ncbi:UNVERIFIED_CONTAM: hypothetical protein PYX00_001456 [Menopon gallinae]|uniref:Transmembrane protein 186 n=1 Tax=Menopon gallinae TaxID=328185 RepID=A0AAW2IE53_9NEOP
MDLVRLCFGPSSKMAFLCTRAGLSQFRSVLISRNEPIRRLGVLNKVLKKNREPKLPTEFDIKQFTPLYSFGFVRSLSVIVRGKLFKFGLSTVLFGTVGYLTATGHIDPTIAALIFWTGFDIFVLYYFAAILPKNVIGRIYFNKKDQKFALSYLNKQGKRVNVVCSAGDIEVADHPGRIGKLYLKRITLKEPAVEMDLYYRRGIIVHNELLFDLHFPKVI